jgi:hypothetical protein
MFNGRRHWQEQRLLRRCTMLGDPVAIVVAHDLSSIDAVATIKSI